MIRTHELTKQFKSRTGCMTALDSLSMSILKGEIFGLLGPNGAGKTTTVKILSTLITPTRGTAIVNGHDIRREERSVRASLGVSVGGERSFYFRLSGYQNLEFFGALHGLSRKKLRQRLQATLARLNLEEYADLKFMKYSSGMKKKLSIARAIMLDVPIYLFDEPTSGIDAHSASDIRLLLREMRDEGKTILLTTHNMGEAEQLCDRIAILDKGKILAVADPASLKSSLRHSTVKVRIDPGRAEWAATQLSMQPLIREIRVDHNGWISMVTYNKADLLGFVYRFALQNSIRVEDASISEPSLEDVFLAMTGRR